MAQRENGSAAALWTICIGNTCFFVSISGFRCFFDNLFVLPQSLGVLEPKGQVDLSLQLLPLAPGVHKVSGLRIVCVEHKVQCDFEQLHEVLVCKANDAAEPINGP
jgi:hypothetical protein